MSIFMLRRHFLAASVGLATALAAPAIAADKVSQDIDWGRFKTESSQPLQCKPNS